MKNKISSNDTILLFILLFLFHVCTSFLRIYFLIIGNQTGSFADSSISGPLTGWFIVKIFIVTFMVNVTRNNFFVVKNANKRNWFTTFLFSFMATATVASVILFAISIAIIFWASYG